MIDASQIERLGIREITEALEESLEALQEIAEEEADPVLVRRCRSVLGDLERLQDGLGELDEYLNL